MSLVIYSLGVDTQTHTLPRMHAHARTHAHTHTHTRTHTHNMCTQTINYDIAIKYLTISLKLALLKFLFQFHDVTMAITSDSYITTYPTAIIIGQMIPPYSSFYHLLYKLMEWLSN